MTPPIHTPVPIRLTIPVLFIAAAVLATTPAPALAATEQADDGFVPLFDGKSLDGWVNVNCAPETWSVVDGMIHCTGFPTGALRTTRQYENFVLEFEWRHLKTGRNAGFFVWAGPISATGQPFLRAIEVQILENEYGKSDWFTTHGDIFPIHGSKMDPFPPSKGSRSFPSESRSKGSPEWNHYRISCQDGVIRLAVNGKEVSGGENCSYRKGYLALESEGGPVDFRGLRIKELPSTGAKPEDTAPEARGHRPLYTGLNLDGWKTADTTGWKPSDWRLVAEAKAAPLVTTENFDDAEIICDWRVAEKKKDDTDSAAALATPPSAHGTARFVVAPLAGETEGVRPAGNWNRTIIRIQGNQRTVIVNDKTIAENEPVENLPAKGPLALLPPGGTKVEFSSIYVRELR